MKRIYERMRSVHSRALERLTVAVSGQLLERAERELRERKRKRQREREMNGDSSFTGHAKLQGRVSSLVSVELAGETRSIAACTERERQHA